MSGAAKVILLLAAAAAGGCGTTPFGVAAGPYGNTGAREPGSVIADGQSCAYAYAGRPMSTSDYAALPDSDRFSWANNGEPVITESTFLSQIDFVYGPEGGYGSGTDLSQNRSVGTLADVWDTQKDPGMSACCHDLFVFAHEHDTGFSASGIGTGAFGAFDERVLFDKLQSCALGAAAATAGHPRLEGSGTQCDVGINVRPGQSAWPLLAALLGLILLRRRGT